MTQPNNRQIGRKGEKIAAAYLQQKGYTILDINWRHSTLEIDIIAQFKNTIVFIEVKYRSQDTYGLPAEFISSQQMENLAIAAGHYTEIHEMDGPCRFDVIGILPKEKPHYSIRHYIDAFFPEW